MLFRKLRVGTDTINFQISICFAQIFVGLLNTGVIASIGFNNFVEYVFVNSLFHRNGTETYIFVLACLVIIIKTA